MKPAAAPIALTTEQIAAAFRPMVSEQFSTGEARWAALEQVRHAKLRRGGLREAPDDALPMGAAEDPAVTRARAEAWLAEKFRVEPGTVAFAWGDQALLAKGIASSRVQLLALMRVVDQYQPAIVAEVGFGSGINLFALAGRFPHIRFSGVEVNADAVRRAHTLQQLELMPAAVRDFSPEPLRDQGAHRRVVLQVGDARTLPWEDGSVDLVFTKLALERMQAFRDTALAELRRVARGHVVMIEAFREWNAEGLRRDYIASKQYFDCAVSELTALGLEPEAVFDDFPHKITHRPALVLARPIR